MIRKIYLDNNATTALDPRVIQVLQEELSGHYGNPSSVHSFGQDNRKRLVRARDEIAAYMNVKPNEIIFTSGGTEALNMVIRGLLAGTSGSHVISSDVEHSAVYATLKQMEKNNGVSVSFLPAGLWGAPKPETVVQALRPNTRLISLMAVNNETGVKTDIHSIAAMAKAARIPFLVDGVALLGKEPFVIPEGVSAMGFSGHKFHGPKGTGFAYIRSGLKLQPILSGGEQEFGRRGGTENMLGIMGLAKAVELLRTELPGGFQKMSILRDYFESRLGQSLSGVTVNGQGPRVSNTSNLSFEGIEGETLLMALDLEGIAVSHGSACASGALEPSRILINMGIPSKQAKSSIRFSFSRFTTQEEVDSVLEIIVRLVNSLRI